MAEIRAMDVLLGQQLGFLASVKRKLYGANYDRCCLYVGHVAGYGLVYEVIDENFAVLKGLTTKGFSDFAWYRYVGPVYKNQLFLLGRAIELVGSISTLREKKVPVPKQTAADLTFGLCFKAIPIRYIIEEVVERPVISNEVWKTVPDDFASSEWFSRV